MHASHEYRTALVLGGGGSTGNAWLIGVLAGLLEAGLDVTSADLTIGTSAGATAAAQLVGASPLDLLTSTLAPPPRSARPSAPPSTSGPPVDHLARLHAIIASSEHQADLRRRLGAAALQLEGASDRARSAQWRATVAGRLPDRNWPEGREVRITAIDARTGDPVVFDRQSGVDLVDAVSASTSSGLPYRIGDALYLDGGYRANAENADLAAGCARVLVLSPLGGRTLTPPSWGTALTVQVEQLRAAGSAVETISPRVEHEQLFGPAAMDLSLRPAAARAGREEGGRSAERIRALWS